MRLLDRLRFSGRGIEPSGAATWWTTYGNPGNEGMPPPAMADAQAAYRCNGVVFGAVLARMSLFSETRFRWRRLTDEALFGSQALRPLERPWPGATTGELLARMIQDVDLAGNAYLWNTGDQLVRLRPDWVTIISELTQDGLGRQFRRVIGYWYEPPAGAAGEPDPFALDVSEVAHWSPIPDPQANFRGMSWLTPVLREVAADDAMTEYKHRYLQNAASPNLLVKYEQRLNQQALENVQAMLAARHGGVANAYKTMVLDEGADVTVIGNTFEQMSFSTVQAAGENRIILASGVPGIVIGSKEGLSAATYSNYEQAMRRFADVTMRPLWRSACAALAPVVEVPSNAELWFDVRDIAALRQGEKERAETLAIKADAYAALMRAGADPASIPAAIESGDLTQLVHTGLVPNTLQNDPAEVAAAASPPELDGTPLPALPSAPNGA